MSLRISPPGRRRLNFLTKREAALRQELQDHCAAFKSSPDPMRKGCRSLERYVQAIFRSYVRSYAVSIAYILCSGAIHKDIAGCRAPDSNIFPLGRSALN
ncbi:hypothetical protein EJ06DRAFT_329341 [Trichodelitschia bisporula]|uniref:Uncharacterized protein n=1 Tax=Trichodelitschia bisporula TaxID=703511 RepID=A0A6G1I1Y8_9PEZI|nr:hypothetical protein EJ06DRAFT_329341 [Trichodelitschia bisporula]